MNEFVKKINNLVDDFSEAEAKGKAYDDPEGDTERLYIEPLFDILGWNMRSREVETQREAGRSGKRTDYSFFVGRYPRFIAEAKASSVSLDGFYMEKGKRMSFSKKTLEYAWNTNVACGVLINFKEIRVYNATAKVSDPSTAYLFPPIKFTEIEKRIDDLLFLSKEYVTKGLLEERIRQQNIEQKLPIRIPIDKAILNSLVKWRKVLVADLVTRYASGLPIKDLIEIVQRIIDRVVFIRVLEDLNLEPMNGLWQIATNPESSKYGQLIKIYQYMDRYYNSMLFSESQADRIEVSDHQIANIITDSYEYKFDRIPLDLFGVFYENYIGHVLNDEGEFVKSNRETKAKGIYYTCPYIVDLICNLTLSKKLEKIKPTKNNFDYVKVLDPACGSGSFTMRAFDEIHSWYRHKFEMKNLKIDFEEKKHILLQNIYGVDIDRQAVEVSSTYHLIGLLKGVSSKPLFSPTMLKDNKKEIVDSDEILEGMPLYRELYVKEREGKYETMHKLVEAGAFHLPTMMGEQSTIRNGNSLVAGTPAKMKHFFKQSHISSVSPFDWYKEFPDILGNPVIKNGFDIIIGNPPYRNMDEAKDGEDEELFGELKNYFQHYESESYKYINWKSYYRRMSDLYYFFFFRGITLLKNSGVLGFITSRSYLEAHYADTLRKFILEQCKIEYIIDFGKVKVFDRASITTAITILEREVDNEKRNNNVITVIKVKKPFAGINFQDDIRLLVERISRNIDNINFSDDHIEVFTVAQASLSGEPWNLANTALESIYQSIDSDHPKLKDLCILGQGMQTGANEVFCQFDKNQIINEGFEKAYIYKRAINSDIHEYQFNHSGKYAIYVEDIADFNDIPRNIKKWLISNKKKLEERAAVIRGDCLWFKYSWPLHKDYYSLQKIICPYRAGKNRFYLNDSDELKVFTDTTVIFLKSSKEYPLFDEYGKADKRFDLYYILGLLNSRLLNFRYRGIGKLTSSDLYEYFDNQIGRLPIKMPKLNDNEEKKLYDIVRRNAKEIQKLYREIQKMPDTFDKRREKMEEIENLRGEIDESVNVLYGVTGLL